MCSRPAQVPPRDRTLGRTLGFRLLGLTLMLVMPMCGRSHIRDNRPQLGS